MQPKAICSNRHPELPTVGIDQSEKLQQDLRAVAADARRLLKRAVRSTTAHISGMPDYLESRLYSVKQQVNQAKTRVEDRALHASAVTTQYLKQHPWKSVGIISASVLLSILLVSVWISEQDSD